ncbi:MAG TPA: hypothetical protein VGI16_06750 [Candidatus Acidoferrum sp.]|jgi:hypothetical protein
MRPGRFLLLITVSLSLAFPAAAQQNAAVAATPQPPQRDAQALKLLAQSAAAMGGANWSAITSTQEIVQYTSMRDGQPATSTRTITTRGNSMRIDDQDASGTSAFVMDATTAHGRGPGEQARPASRRALGNGGLTHLPALSAFARWTGSDVSATYVGLEDVAGSKLHHIILQLPPNTSFQPPRHEPPCHIYLDPQTLLVTQFTYSIRALTNLRVTAPVTVKYEDYRVVQGVQIPFKVTYLMDSNVVGTHVVTSISLNVAVPDSTFQLGGAL